MTIAVSQIDEWLATPAEHERLEFKLAASTFQFDTLLDYCVALANECGGSLVLGITNERPRHVKGTAAFPNVQGVREQLFNTLRRRIEVDEVMHPGGRVLVFTVPSRPQGEALHRNGRYLMRVGERLESMSFDQLQRIAAEAQHDPSARVIIGADLASLDPRLIAIFREKWSRKSSSPAIARLDDAQLLSDAGLLCDGAVTLGALVLFGTPEAVRRHVADFGRS